MADPAMLTIATAVATAIAGKSAEALGETAKNAIATLAAKVRAKLHSRADDSPIKAIAVVPEAAEEESVRLELAAAIERAVEGDPEFGRELVELVRLAGLPEPAAGGSTHTIIAGNIGKSVSAGGDINISGGLHL